jgi:hypothetical protein
MAGVAPDDPVVHQLLDGEAVEKLLIHVRLPVGKMALSGFQAKLMAILAKKNVWEPETGRSSLQFRKLAF